MTKKQLSSTELEQVLYSYFPYMSPTNLPDIMKINYAGNEINDKHLSDEEKIVNIAMGVPGAKPPQFLKDFLKDGIEQSIAK